MGDAAWVVVAALALGCAVLVWRIVRTRRPGRDAGDVEVAEPAPTALAPAPGPAVPKAVQAPAPSVLPSVPPAPVVPVAKAPVAAPSPATVLAPPELKPPPAPVPLVTVSPAIARAPRFDLLEGLADEPVLRLERASAAQWQGAAVVDATPVQRDGLARLLVHAGRLDAVPGSGDLYALRLRRASALALARGRLGGSAGAALQSQPPHALDAVLAAQAAAVMLALHCSPAYLQGLRARVGETKTISAALHPKLLAQNEGRLKSLLQDLTRYLREAEENYAGAVRKPVFIARVGETCAQAGAFLQSAQEAAAAARSVLEAQARAPRFGEVQLEKALAALRDLQGQRRVQDCAARVLAGWQMLRLALGDAASGAAESLRDAGGGLTMADAADRTLAGTLEACLESAKLPDYVGKAEFITNRNAARELLKRIAAESFVPAVQQLAQAADAIGAGFAGDAALALLLRLDAQGAAVELRVPRAAA